MPVNPTNDTVSYTDSAGMTQQAQGVVVLSSSQTAEATGVSDEPAWDGISDSATIISLLKAMYAQNQMMIMELNEISANTMRTP
jgi:hypothetical protein